MMIQDKDLEFLQYCTNPDLFDLCNIITTYGNCKFNGKDNLQNENKRCDANYLRDICRDIAVELRRLGGNKFLNKCRHGQGPSYRSIVSDVCKKMEVKGVKWRDTVEDMEHKLLSHVMGKMVEKLSAAEVEQMMNDLKIKKRSYRKQGIMAALLIAGDFQFVLHAFQYISRVMTTKFAEDAAMMMGLGILSSGAKLFFSPFGWVLCGAWTAWNMAGPTYKVTVPAVLQVAYMRMKYNAMYEKYTKHI